MSTIAIELSGYRVRVEGGDFFMIEENDTTAEEVFTLRGAIEAAEAFIADTVDAAKQGHLSAPYSPLELEIVSPDGRTLSLDLARTLALCPRIPQGVVKC